MTGFSNSRCRVKPVVVAIGATLALVVSGCATTSKEPRTAGAAEDTGKTAPKAAPKAPGARTVADVLKTIGPEAEKRLRKRFAAAGVRYPPKQVHLLAFKEEKRLELWAAAGGQPRRIAVFPLLDESGALGPKLREGDYQIPEGFYRVIWLHPNSQYHLSMKLDYPNEFDREQAKKEGRTDLGGQIFIHGRDVSIGCLAVGDPAIEELFVLAARVGIDRVSTIIAPRDLRTLPPPDLGERELAWVPFLYAQIASKLAAFR